MPLIPMADRVPFPKPTPRSSRSLHVEGQRGASYADHMATITARQYIVMRLWYVEGWSQYRIAKGLGITQPSVYGLIARGRRWIFEAVSEEGAITLRRVEVLLAPSPTSSPTSNLGVAASRQDELLDALELLMEHQASEAAIYDECMSGDSILRTHVKRNTFDLWELRYAMAHQCAQLPSSAYNAHIASRYCDAYLA